MKCTGFGKVRMTIAYRNTINVSKIPWIYAQKRQMNNRMGRNHHINNNNTINLVK